MIKFERVKIKMVDYQKELDYNSQIDRLRSAVRLLRLYRRADPSNIYNAGANGFGTGFFVERKSQNILDNKIYLVSNRHVFEGMREVCCQLAISSNDKEETKLSLTIHGKIRNHPNSSVDLAAVDVTDQIRELRKQTPHIIEKINPFPYEIILPQQTITTLPSGVPFTYIGYPGGAESAYHQPEPNQGSTANPGSEPYQETPQFLVKGFIQPGASGSPVFVNFSTPKLLGIVTDMLVVTEEYKDEESKAKVSFRQIKGGYVVWASCLMELLNQMS